MRGGFKHSDLWVLLNRGELFRRLICAVDLGPMGLGPMGLGPMGLGPMGLGPLGCCGLDAKEQKNGRQWDAEN